jgi:hypothetical protein
MKKSMRAIRGAGMGALAIGAILTGALAASSAVASATAGPGDQDAVTYAAEMNAAAVDTSDDVTASQARNNAAIVCGMRSGHLSGSKHPDPFTEREVIEQFGGDHWATVMVTRGEYHFCPEYH